MCSYASVCNVDLYFELSLSFAFRCLQIDSSTWHGLEEIASSSPAKHHIGAV